MVLSDSESVGLFACLSVTKKVAISCLRTSFRQWKKVLDESWMKRLKDFKIHSIHIGILSYICLTPHIQTCPKRDARHPWTFDRSQIGLSPKRRNRLGPMRWDHSLRHIFGGFLLLVFAKKPTQSKVLSYNFCWRLNHDGPNALSLEIE